MGGLTGAFLPLSMVAVRAPIKEHFETNPIGWGATFHAHPVCLAAGYECVKYMLEHDLVNRAKNIIEPILKEQIDRVVKKYDSVARGPVQNFDGSDCRHVDAVTAFRTALRENGIYGFVRPPLFHCAPALIIQPDELEDGWQRADRALEIYDRTFWA